MPDVSAAIAPKSQQLDNIELRGKGPQIFTITGVDVREALDQPLIVHLAEFPRPWKPGKTMGRVLAQCWGLDSDDWIGKRVELFADESIKFGNDTPGGTRISRLSDIDGPKSAAILLGQGKPGLYKVDPLPDAPAPVLELTDEELAAQVVDGLKAATTEAEIREWGNRAHGRGLLDIQVNGQVLRDHVTEALAVLADQAVDVELVTE